MAEYSFEDKQILVTGATGGIGGALATLLSEAGASLLLSSRSGRSLEQLIKKLPFSNRAQALSYDLSVPGEAEKLADKALEIFGHVDVFFNLAGVGYFALMEEATEKNIRYLFELNTFSPVILMNRLIPHMIRQRGGRIINIVSCAGRIPIPTEGVYGGSKSALAVMANTMRFEVALQNIDILNIYAGTSATEFERNARRENERPGVCPVEGCGEPLHDMAKKIFKASSGPPGEVWLEKEAKWMAAGALIFPKFIDNRLKPLRDRALGPVSLMFPNRKRPWRLWQVESAIACNLKCIMCPWTEFRLDNKEKGRLQPDVWNALKPHLGKVQSIDFTGGGEPLLQPYLIQWIQDAHGAGCETGFLTNGLLLSKDKAAQVIEAGIDWICFSVDGSDADIYERIRVGSNFNIVTHNISDFCRMRPGKRLKTMINFVIMTVNAHQLEDIVRLAAQLGVDQVNFKQCDVIRGEHGKEMGVFSIQKTSEVKTLERSLAKALKLAKKLNIKTTAFSFTPEELPVCAQDPRDSIFIRYDGTVAPCINLALGGPTTFLGKNVTMPSVHYGCLPETDIDTLWQTKACRFYRERFEQRVQANEKGFLSVDLTEPSLMKLKAANQAAIDAMPNAPEGCRICHYLFDI